MNRSSFFAVAGALAASALATGAGAAATPSTNHISGTIVAVSGNALILQTREGKIARVDVSEARANGRVGVLAPHIPIELFGAYAADGTFHCVRTSHAGPAPGAWEPDR
jgi:hypothetical protein